MKGHNHIAHVLLAAGFGMLVSSVSAQTATPAKTYNIVKSAQVMGTGGIDYVTADSDSRRLYVPRGNEVLVFDLDTLKAAGSIATGRAHGVAVDPRSHHAFCSSSPVVMWDSETLKIIKSIDVQGRPDGIFFEPQTEHIFVFSHSAPNATVIDGKDGSVVGTVDLGGAPEQAQSDGQGHLYVDLEDQDKIAVVDVNTLKVTAQFTLGGKGGGPAGLGLDAKNHILFAACAASGGLQPYTFTIQQGFLSANAPPPGLSMGKDGTLAGTPTTAGTYPFTVTVVDSLGNLANASFAVTITTQLLITTSSPLPPGVMSRTFRMISLRCIASSYIVLTSSRLPC
jgi:DNA-binding beta-propeller fold protein YncE